MQIVIDIDEDTYRYMQSRCRFQNKGDKGLSKFEEAGVAIKNGTPLPENHGRLIDGDALENRLNASAEYWLDTDSRLEAKFGKGIAEAADTIGDMETIVEAQNIGKPVERKYKLIEYKA